MNVISVRSSQNRFYIADRDFSMPDLTLLVDAVSDARTITKEQSDVLMQHRTKTAFGFVRHLLAYFPPSCPIPPCHTSSMPVELCRRAILYIMFQQTATQIARIESVSPKSIGKTDFTMPCLMRDGRLAYHHLDIKNFQKGVTPMHGDDVESARVSDRKTEYRTQPSGG